VRNVFRNELYKLFRTKKLYLFSAIMVAVLLLNLHSYEPGSPMTVWTFRYGQSVPLASIDILSQFMVIFIPIYLADSVTHEEKTGTLKLSLLRPIRRNELLQAKLASLLVFIAVMVAFYAAAAYAIGAYYLGWGDGTEYAGQQYSPAEGIGLTLAAYALLILPFMTYGLFVTAVALLSSHVSIAIISALVIMTIGLNLNGWEAIAPYSLAYQIVYYHEAFIGPFDGSLALQRTGILALYAALFSFFSFHIFNRKAILR